MSLPEQMFIEAVWLLRGDDGGTSTLATKAALRVLVGTTAHGWNQVNGPEAGAVASLVDMLLLIDSGRPWWT